MRVLLIDVNCKYSSTGKIVYDLYTELNDNGHRAAICYGRGPLINEQDIYKFSSNIEVYAHALLTRITGLTGYYSYFATRKLIKFIDDFKPDVVHIHELHAYFVNINPIISYLKKSKIKTVWTFHCEFMYTGKCGHSFECEKWKVECHECPQLKDYPKSLFFDFTRKMFHDKKDAFKDFHDLTIVTPSKWLADRVRQSFLKDKQIVVINNGIETKSIFHPRKFEHLKTRHNISNEKVILAVAPDIMSINKGGHHILSLAKNMKDKNIKFILIGVKNLDEKFDDKFDDNVIALGRTDNQDELAKYYSMADIFAICSTRENFPTTCIESLSCGTPVIGFDEGGTKETAPEEYGAFVKYGDINSLKDIIEEIFAGKKYLKNKESCARFGHENYDKSVMLAKYMNIYVEDTGGI